MGTKVILKYYVLVLLFGIVLSNCTSLKNTEQIKLNEKNVEYIMSGNGSPTVVFETGMGPTVNTWDAILDSLSVHTKVYAYNRPGYGNSSIHNVPRSVIEVAEQLHQNLIAQNIQPPYLLVGHSAGGLYINMFARMYPKEVIGLVFIDASHPEQFEYFKSDQVLLYNLLITAAKKGKCEYELDIINSSSASFIDAPEFPQIPLTVLTAGKSSPLESKKLREKWLYFQNDLVKLSNKNRQIIVEKSGHYIHKNEPDLVISEILRIKEIVNGK